MASEFSLGMFNKIKVKDGYLILGKGGAIVRLSEIKSFNVTKNALVVNSGDAKLATIKGLSESKAYAVMDFINAERDKFQSAGKNAKSAASSVTKDPKTFLLTAIIVIVLAVIIVAVYYFMGAPAF